MHDISGFFQAVQAGFQSGLAHSRRDDRYVGRAAVAEFAEDDIFCPRHWFI
jgi:hypothetical protein